MPYKPIDDHTRRNMLQLLEQAGQLVTQIEQYLELIKLAGAGITHALEAQENETDANT